MTLDARLYSDSNLGLELLYSKSHLFHLPASVNTFTRHALKRLTYE
jgi:hypothetical protein